ncbi:spheroidene monooxygenase [Sulfitobacter sabulilitoris]|uniref:Spheroidene monooxygenase n=1 Tax=Sulfitobacter sabulilitoris TaxID=2562655 RepID=A0A5S3PAS1_9RHOB|nr:spheroidene monooxygenase [Sulfitobacter sabulilitoris]TMM50568.1 spheroidene monooxygenase [Sulfitobacter sabulilitoris]
MTASPIVTLSFFRFSGLGARLWALGMMGGARMPLARVPDIGFWKLCGSGTGEGFTPLPNTGVYAILATWPNEATARRRLSETAIFRRYRDRAAEDWTVFLATRSVRGRWSGKTPFAAASLSSGGPLAALTRATIKPRIALKFWSRVPNISRMIGSDPKVAFKIGIGEVPLMHQVTFSIWPDADSMADFARANGPHADAIRAVRAGSWFSEELYARFAILGDSGTWGGTSPLANMETHV